MRGRKSDRHTTEAEDEEMEFEKDSQDLFDLLKPNHRRPQTLKIIRKNFVRQMDQEEEIATRKNKVMKKHKRGGTQSSSFRKAA